jgi:hypothetical protein
MMGQKFASYDAQLFITGLYDDVDSPVPDGVDAIALSDLDYAMLLAGQAAGRRMALDAAHAPTLVDAPAPVLTAEQRARQLRGARDTALRVTDGIVARHQDEVLLARGTTLDTGQFAALLAYRAALRDLPAAANWPDLDLPAPPAWLAPRD